MPSVRKRSAAGSSHILRTLAHQGRNSARETVRSLTAIGLRELQQVVDVGGSLTQCRVVQHEHRPCVERDGNYLFFGQLVVIQAFLWAHVLAFTSLAL